MFYMSAFTDFCSTN